MFLPYALLIMRGCISCALMLGSAARQVNEGGQFAG